MFADIASLFAEGRRIPGVGFDFEYRSEHLRAVILSGARIGPYRIVLGRISIDGQEGDYFVARYDDAGTPRGSQMNTPVFERALEVFEYRVAAMREELGS